MRVLAFFLTYIVALHVAIACPPPFNNRSIVSYSTSTTAELIEASLLKSGTGWIEVVTPHDNEVTKWPRSRSETVTKIAYCYADAEAKTELSRYVDQAIELWYRKIGQPGACSGHSLEIKEYTSFLTTSRPYCYEQTGPLRGTWNMAMPDEILVIKRETNPHADAASATLGYEPGFTHDRNDIRINKAGMLLKDAPWLIAHEFGHVFGLFHEHQRNDRDDYLHFECKNLMNYEEVKRLVESRREDTIEQVCESSELGFKYGWNVHNWVKGSSIYDLNEGPFDPKSIMLYESKTGMQVGKDPKDVYDVPLVLWRDHGPNHPTERNRINCDIFEPNTEVSDGDYEAIKYMYPWKDPSGATFGHAKAHKKIRALKKTLMRRAG